MKNLICLVLVLFSTNVFAASGSGNVSSIITPGGSSGITNGGTSPVSLPLGSLNAKTYFVQATGPTGAGAVTAAHYYSFVKLGYSGQWKVPSGKIAFCMQQQYVSNNTGTPQQQLQFGHSTSTFLNDTTPSPVSCYNFDGNCTSQVNGSIVFYTPTANIAPITYNYPLIFDASASPGANADIYPFVRPAAANTMFLGLLCTETP